MAKQTDKTEATQGYKRWQALKPAQLAKAFDAIESHLLANGEKRKANNPSAFALLVAHSLPVTHIEAVEVAKMWYEHKGLPFELGTTFATGSQWHSTRATKPMRKVGNLARYDANAGIAHAGANMACEVSRSTYRHDTHNGTGCSKTCGQGLLAIGGDKWLFELATTYKFNDLYRKVDDKATGKAKAKRKAKAKATTPKATNESPTPNVESDIPQALADRLARIEAAKAKAEATTTEA